MSDQNLPAWLKPALELGPIFAFFAAYLMLKDRIFTIGGTEYEGFIIVTALFVPVLLISMGVLWRLTGHLSKMQIVTAVMVVVFGGLTVWFNDGSFFKMKPTIIYLIFGGILGFGVLRGTSYLQALMDSMLPLTDTGWLILTRRLVFFFFGLAVLNEIIWRTQSDTTWVYFKTFGLTAAIFLFFMTQGRLFESHNNEEKDATDTSE